MPYRDTLTTGRLLLRPLAAEDLDAAQAWAGNPDNTRYMSWGPNTVEQTRQWLEQTCPGKDFGVVLRDSGTLIGSCGIIPDEANDSAELGWILHKDHWMYGYGTELGGELIRYGFEDLGLRRIFAPCAAVNYGSYRVMERNGMRREALRVKAFWARVDQEWVDCAEYAILADEYFAKSSGVEPSGVDCCFRTPYGIFSYRVGAVIRRGDAILMVTNETADYYYSVGGRVGFGETTAAALQREVFEELGVVGEVGPLVLVHENLFTERGTKYHEIGLYYLYTLPADKPVRTEQPAENGMVERFEWLPINALDGVAIYPDVLKTGLADLTSPTHSITNEWTREA